MEFIFEGISFHSRRFRPVIRGWVILCALLLIVQLSLAQADTVGLGEIRHFQNELNEEFRNPGKSPLDPKALKQFTEHDFFPVDLSYRVTAKLMVTSSEPVFKMKTTSSKLRDYRKYGEVQFRIGNTEYKLNIYQSLDLMKQEAYKDYLFLPFTDLTNDTETYSGGRYIGLYIPKSGNSIIIDFNQAYNPYCAYSPGYSCPIVPAENHLDIKIPAGVRLSKQ